MDTLKEILTWSLISLDINMLCFVYHSNKLTDCDYCQCFLTKLTKVYEFLCWENLWEISEFFKSQWLNSCFYKFLCSFTFKVAIKYWENAPYCSKEIKTPQHLTAYHHAATFYTLRETIEWMWTLRLLLAQSNSWHRISWKTWEESFCVTKQWMDSQQFWGLETLKMENLIFIESAGTSGNNTLVLHNHVSKGRLKTFVLFV